jgi:hypothetical protein
MQSVDGFVEYFLKLLGDRAGPAFPDDAEIYLTHPD